MVLSSNTLSKGPIKSLSKISFHIHFKVAVRACYGAYFVAHVFKYLAPNFVSREDALQSFCTTTECETIRELSFFSWTRGPGKMQVGHDMKLTTLVK